MRTTRSRRLFGFALVLVVMGGSAVDALAQTAPTIGVTGGLSVLDPGNDPRQIPGVFTWGTVITLTGANWVPFENLSIHLVGPLNTAGTAPVDREVFNVLYPLNAFPADDQGRAGGRFGIPFVGPPASGSLVPEVVPPGRYMIYALSSDPSSPPRRADSGPFTIVADSIAQPYYDIVQAHNWGSLRGGRDGWLQGHSPERVDPEWITVWSQRPVEMYGTVAATDTNGANQPSIISYQDYPTTHYAHDADVLMVPDDDFKWVLATANFTGALGFRGTGRIEWEWETQNSGSPYVGSYGHGNIGLPLYAMPTVGDRVYTVGHWALDNGHPESGDKAEIHPARMIATIRKRQTVAPLAGVCMTRAQQVDVYVSGHGGGSNRYYDRLEEMLDNEGRGGGRVPELMPQDVKEVYERYGPKPTVSVIDDLVSVLGFLGLVPDIADQAGPSALATDSDGAPSLSGDPWVIGAEERPINDMDYDFDVRLPPAPPGATQPLVQVTQYPWHTTQVEEAITYTGRGKLNGLPTTAHVHLPYLGADNGVYARTLRFYWDTFSKPGAHFLVTLNDVQSARSGVEIEGANFYLGPQPLYLWSDVSGQWTFLSERNPAAFLAPALSDKSGVDTADLGSPGFDVYLDASDTLRVFTMGYAQRKMDELFEKLDGLNSYDSGIAVAAAALLDTGDNQDLGGALFDSPWVSSPVLGPHAISADPGESGPVNTLNGAFPPISGSVITTDFTVESIPSPGHAVVVGSANLGSVCLGSTVASQFQVENDGETLLGVTGVAVSGGGWSVIPDRPVPYVLPNLMLSKMIVRFTPTAVDQGSGRLTVTSDDACIPSIDVPLQAEVLVRQAALPDALHFGILPVGDRARNASQTLSFTIGSTGSCALVLNGIALTAGDLGDFKILSLPSFPATIAPGDSLSVPVQFNPRKGGLRAATLSVTLGNDPVHATPYDFSVDGGGSSPKTNRTGRTVPWTQVR